MALNIHRILQNALKGAPTAVRKRVTFVSETAGAFDASTLEHGTPTRVEYAGLAAQVSDNLRRYAELKLIPSATLTLMFIPDTENVVPPLDATVEWGGVVYSVRDIGEVAPIGSVLAASIVVSR